MIKKLQPQYVINSDTEMLALGATIAAAFKKHPAKIYLSGELGAGKTTLVRGFLRSFGYQGVVKSPTYTLVETYHLGLLSIYHFDFYRVTAAEELHYIGITDYFVDEAYCLVEWSERAKEILPAADLQCVFDIKGTQRLVTLELPGSPT